MSETQGDIYDIPEFVVPNDKAKGCLPRASKFGDVCKLAADSIEVIPRERWPQLIQLGASLRPHVRQVLDQDGVGSCATEATAQSVMIIRDVAEEGFKLLNPWSIYRVTSGGSDNGSNIDTNLVFARDVGILPEEYWPRNKGWRSTPPDGWKEIAKQYRIDEFYDIGSILEVGSSLLVGFPVVFGWNGHSCVLTRLLSESVAEYVNSWEATWGDAGFGKIYLSSINFSYGAFSVRTARHGSRAT